MKTQRRDYENSAYRHLSEMDLSDSEAVIQRTQVLISSASSSSPPPSNSILYLPSPPLASPSSSPNSSPFSAHSCNPLQSSILWITCRQAVGQLNNGDDS